MNRFRRSANRQVHCAIALCLLILWQIGCSAESRQDTDISNQTDAQEVFADSEIDRSDLPPLERAVLFLLNAQSDDGIWRSEYYGNLKQGAATSALVLYALAHAKPHLNEWPKADFERAMIALQEGIRKNGFVSNKEGPDYSNYASAMYLLAANRAGFKITDEIEDKIVDYLIRAQLDEAEGFTPDDPDYGGWDLSGWMTGHRMTTGTNISVSSTVIEALMAYYPLSDKQAREYHKSQYELLVRSGHSKNAKQRVEPTITKAIGWLKKCQNFVDDRKEGAPVLDGGFFFHPKRNHDGNKSEWEDEVRSRPRSYGTATADGLRTLNLIDRTIDLADSFGGQEEDRFRLLARITKAESWFEENAALNRVPGFDWETNESKWQDGLLYYFLYSRAKTVQFDNSESNLDVLKQIDAELTKRQKKDGSWQNRVALMREDDPLIATCFAVLALSESKSGLGTN